MEQRPQSPCASLCQVMVEHCTAGSEAWTDLVICTSKVEGVKAERPSHEGGLGGRVAKGIHLPAYAGRQAKGAVQELVAHSHLIYHCHIVSSSLIILHIPA